VIAAVIGLGVIGVVLLVVLLSGRKKGKDDSEDSKGRGQWGQNESGRR
jgi:hypothetical protein